MNLRLLLVLTIEFVETNIIGIIERLIFTVINAIIRSSSQERFVTNFLSVR